MGSSFRNYIKKECPKEYKKYKKVVNRYSIRLKPLIKRDGCQIVEIYNIAYLSKNHSLMDRVEEDRELSKRLLFLFSIDKIFKEYLLKNPKSVEFLNSSNSFKRLKYLIEERFNEDYHFFNNINFINYFLLSSHFSKDNQKAIKLLNRLENSIAIDELNDFILMVNYLKGIKFEKIVTLFNRLGKERVENISKYPTFFKYFTSSNQKEIIYLYDILMSRYNSIETTLYTISKLYPYIQKNNYILFKEFFKNLINSRLIENLYQRTICSNSEKYLLFKNLNKALIFNHKYSKSYQLMQKLSPFRDGLELYFYVTEEYFSLNDKKWSVFSDLLFNLTDNIEFSLSLIKFLKEKTNYFTLLDKYKDYDKFVFKNSSDRIGVSAKKYLYILKTAYPSDNNNSIIGYFYNKSVSEEFIKNGINELFKKDIEELKRHNWTDYEKAIAFLDELDNFLTMVDMISIPYTLGVSSSLIAVKRVLKREILNKRVERIDKMSNRIFKVQIGYQMVKNFSPPPSESKRVIREKICE